MITTIRASKRIALGGFLGTGILFISLLAVKDMNDKLGVMTASNAGYQKMTDSQADKIKSLNNELESLRASKVSVKLFWTQYAVRVLYEIVNSFNKICA